MSHSRLHPSLGPVDNAVNKVRVAEWSETGVWIFEAAGPLTYLENKHDVDVRELIGYS